MGVIKVSNPLVSVVIPTFNRKDFIFKAIDSVFNQSYKNVEIIVVDDGSQDGTTQLIKDKCKNGIYDKNRIRVLRFEKNQGIPRSLNAGYKVSSGKYVCQLSSDDYLLDEHKILLQVQVFEEENNKDVGLIYTDYVFKDLDENKEWNVDCYRWINVVELFLRLFRDCCMNACTFLMRKSFLEYIGYYSLDPHLEWNQDLDFNFRACLANEKWRILHMRNYYSTVITIHSRQASKQGKCGLGNDILIPEMFKKGVEKGWIRNQI